MEHYTREHLPVPVEKMRLYRKTYLTPMVVVDGPFKVTTREGDIELPAGWKGLLAIDKHGYPYPVAMSEWVESYAPVEVD